MSDHESGFAQIAVTRKTGTERLRRGTEQLAFTIQDFWAWSASELVSNATRGILAEFIIATALGLANGVRAEWDSFDLKTRAGAKIEVKSAAYLQSWYQKRLSSIC